MSLNLHLFFNLQHVSAAYGPSSGKLLLVGRPLHCPLCLPCSQARRCFVLYLISRILALYSFCGYHSLCRFTPVYVSLVQSSRISRILKY
jgi:hypothetical protein